MTCKLLSWLLIGDTSLNNLIAVEEQSTPDVSMGKLTNARQASFSNFWS